MDKEFVNPNLHVVLIHYPLALLIVGTLIEVFSFMWRRHGFRAAGRWMILLGALSAVPTSLSGIYALRDVATSEFSDAPWKEVVASSPLTAVQWEVLREHVWLSSMATALAVLVVVTWLGCSDRWRSRLHLPLLVLLLVSVGFIAAAANHGGEAVYDHGTGVARASPGEPTTGPAQSESAADGKAIIKKVQFYLPPMQAHVILAGVSTAIALAALGLSIRKVVTATPPTQVDHIAAALGPPPTLIGDEQTDRIDPPDVNAPLHPVSRFWLLACLIGVLTAAVGYWLIAGDSGMSIPEVWRAMILDKPRRLAHLIAGVAIIVLPLLLAGLARWAPRAKLLLIPVALLLLAAIAFQVWMGILLMFDSFEGPLNRFN